MALELGGVEVLGILIGGMAILGAIAYTQFSALKTKTEVKQELRQEITDKAQSEKITDLKRELDKKANKP